MCPRPPQGAGEEAGEGIEKGIEQGMVLGLRESVLSVLRGRFKKVSSATERRVNQASAKELPALIARAATLKRGEAL